MRSQAPIPAVLGLCLLVGCQPVHVSSRALAGYDPETRAYLQGDEVWVELKAFHPDGVERWDLAIDGGNPETLSAASPSSCTVFRWRVGREKGPIDKGTLTGRLISPRETREITVTIRSQAGRALLDTLRIIVQVAH